MRLLSILSILSTAVAAFLVPAVSHSYPDRRQAIFPAKGEKKYSQYVTALSFSGGNASILDKTDINTESILDKALMGKVEESSVLLNKISVLRQKNDTDALNHLLDEILSIIETSKKPLWTRFRITTRLSKRSRFASLKRLLDMSTPVADDESQDSDDAKHGRRKRALAIALRSLVSNAKDGEDQRDLIGIPIRNVEKAAIQDQKVSASDMDSRVPAGLETPKYEVITKRQLYEIRKYNSFSVCSVPMSKPRPDALKTDERVSNPQLSGASSFGALAGYLFGKNDAKLSMKMTTPVLTTGDGENKEMSFVLPSTYWGEDSLSKAPNPLRDSLVSLKRDAGGLRAVIMFGGFATSKDVDSKKSALLNALERDKDWRVADDSTFTLGQYNDPFTPPWRRRNEVSIPVTKRE